MPYGRLRGFQDITGDAAALFARAEAAARRVFGIFGFEEIRVPVLEEKALFARALGEATDVVQKEMYEFEDRSKTRVALRPEGTAGVVRAYLENNFHKTEGLTKFFYMGPMFRSERPQAGRLRQFHQIGVETLGADSPWADAEAIQCLALFLDRAGISSYEIKLNNLGTFEERGDFRQELHRFFSREAGALCEDCGVRLVKNVFRILDCKNPSCREIVKKSSPITGYLGKESRGHFDAVCEALSAIGIRYSLDPYMVRGLDYYTKTVFEVSHPKLGAQDALAAGGRYDRLVETFGGPRAGAVGFAAGVERLAMCMADAGAAEKFSENAYFIVTLGERAFKEGFKILSALRARGVRVSMDFAGKSMKSQMRAADKSQSRHVLILGDNELDGGTCTVKDMQTGTQELQPLESYLASLRGKE
ncbi:MAG: histidine--tRNA ligase [Candidatus Omnitrophica bacterium]|nr:histidine--tRNA ligase [Candidatus Omnitrophota bacterium]